MVRPPESTTDRLNRELGRLRLRSVGLWGSLALAVLILGVILAPIPIETRHARGTFISAAPLMLESGPVLDLRVELDGTVRAARTRANLVYPAPGAPVCLRISRRILGNEAIALADMRHCDGPIATEAVE